MEGLELREELDVVGCLADEDNEVESRLGGVEVVVDVECLEVDVVPAEYVLVVGYVFEYYGCAYPYDSRLGAAAHAVLDAFELDEDEEEAAEE